MTWRRPQLSIHVKAEMSDPAHGLWKCRECEQELKGTTGVHNHYHDQHRGLAPRSCKDCNITTTADRALWAHTGRMHTQPADEHVCKQRECGFCKNTWPKRAGGHKKDCPNPEGILRDGWYLDRVLGKFQRIVPSHGEDIDEMPESEDENPQAEVPQSLSSASSHAPRRSRRNTKAVSLINQPIIDQNAPFTRPSRSGRRNARQTRSRSNSVTQSHSISQETPPRDALLAASDYNALVNWYRANGQGQVHDPHSVNQSPFASRADSHAPHHDLNPSNDDSWLDPQMRSTTPLNPYLGPDGTINPSVLSDPVSHLRKKPQLSLGKARIPITHRQALRYRDLLE